MDAIRPITDDPLSRDRLILFGGTFDPPHEAHRVMIDRATDKYPEAGLLVEPTDSPPHKDGPVASFGHRSRMIEALIDHEAAGLSCLQQRQSGEGYTAESLRRLREVYDGRINLLMGGDSAADFYDWHQPDMILLRATPLVVPRVGFGPDAVVGSLNEQHNYSTAESWRDFFLTGEQSPAVSSTEIRETLPDHRPDGLADPVWSYIQEKGLYGLEYVAD